MRESREKKKKKKKIEEMTGEGTRRNANWPPRERQAGAGGTEKVTVVA